MKQKFNKINSLILEEIGNKSLDKKINYYEKIIDLLQDEKEKLSELAINNASSLKDKFYIWLGKDNHVELSYIPTKDRYPNIRNFIDHLDIDLDRHQTYEIYDYFSEEFSLWLDVGDEELSDEEKVTVELVKLAAEEMIEKNVISFEYDW